MKLVFQEGREDQQILLIDETKSDLGLTMCQFLPLPRTLAVGESGRICTGVGSREHGKNGSGDHKGLKTL